MKTECPYCEVEAEATYDMYKQSVWTDIYGCCGNSAYMVDGEDNDDMCESDARVKVSYEMLFDCAGGDDLEWRAGKICADAYSQWVGNAPKEDSLLCNCGAELEIGDPEKTTDIGVSCPKCEKSITKDDEYELFREYKYHSRMTGCGLEDECEPYGREILKKTTPENTRKVAAWLYRELRKAEKELIGEPPEDFFFM